MIKSKKLKYALITCAVVIVGGGFSYYKLSNLTPTKQVQAFLYTKGVNGGNLIHQKKQMIPMRDGVRLTTDIFRLDEPDKKYPVILVRTP